MLGRLTFTIHGQTLLAKVDFFPALLKYSPSPSREYLLRLILSHLDFSTEKCASRDLLRAWTRFGSRTFRLFSVSLMRKLLHQSSADAFVWAIRILALQLDYSDQEVALSALELLEEATSASKLCLEALIDEKPSFRLVREHAHNLELSFLASKKGVDLLNSALWFEPPCNLVRRTTSSAASADTKSIFSQLFCVSLILAFFLFILCPASLEH